MNTAKIMDGRPLANKIKEKVKSEIDDLGFHPTLATILVGKNPASKLYMDLQTKTCGDVGITTKKHFLQSSTPQSQVLELIKDLNKNKEINGILLQLPLPKTFDTRQILQEITPTKDVEGVTPSNLGKLMHGTEAMIPPTPKSILQLLDHYQIELEGVNIVIINHSIVVGRPLSQLLLNRNATISVCHEYTKNLEFFTRNADIIITATGIPDLITADKIKADSVVIDAGIARTEDGVKGDVDSKNVTKKASYLTPVPGGVGPITLACLLENIVKVSKNQRKKHI